MGIKAAVAQVGLILPSNFCFSEQSKFRALSYPVQQFLQTNHIHTPLRSLISKFTCMCRPGNHGPPPVANPYPLLRGTRTLETCSTVDSSSISLCLRFLDFEDILSLFGCTLTAQSSTPLCFTYTICRAHLYTCTSHWLLLDTMISLKISS